MPDISFSVLFSVIPSSLNTDNLCCIEFELKSFCIMTMLCVSTIKCFLSILLYEKKNTQICMQFILSKSFLCNNLILFKPQKSQRIKISLYLGIKLVYKHLTSNIS